MALVWLWAKGVASPIIGATKPQYFDDAADALEISLTKDELAVLEECYVPHPIVGAAKSCKDNNKNSAYQFL